MRRLALVAAALLPRLLIGALTFGSEDGVASLRNTVAILQGGWADTPYFPFIELWIWTAGRIAYYTALPVMVPYKLLPIAADCLIALLLYDAAGDERRGTRDALLYAFSPLAIWICAVHMQWDSLWLYFLLLALVLLRVQGTIPAAFAGASLVLSVVAKPIAVPLAIVLLPLMRRRGLAFAGGAAAMAAIYAAILASIGWLLSLDNVLFIFRYARKGVQLFGLPYHAFGRLWTTLAVLAALWLLYALRKVTRDEAVLLFFCAVMGLAGLSPQYLCWIVPFAIVSGRTRFLGAYTLLAGLFLVFYYRIPLLNNLSIENMGAYGFLKPLGAWSPPIASPTLVFMTRFLGNWVIPLFCLGYVVHEVLRIVRKNVRRDDAPAAKVPLRYAIPPLFVAVLVAIAAVVAGRWPAIEPRSFILRVERKITDDYDVLRYRGQLPPGRGKVWVPRAVVEKGRPILNAGTVAGLWVIAAAAMTFAWRREDAPA